jgi:hypothetical protein
MVVVLVEFTRPLVHCWFPGYSGGDVPPADEAWGAGRPEDPVAILVTYDAVTGEEWLTGYPVAPESFAAVRELSERRDLDVHGPAPQWTYPARRATVAPTATPFPTPDAFRPPPGADESPHGDFPFYVGNSWTYRVAVWQRVGVPQMWAGAVVVRVTDVRRVGADTWAVLIDRRAIGSGDRSVIPDVLGYGPASSPAWLLVHEGDLYEPSRFTETLTRLLAGEVPPESVTREPTLVTSITPLVTATPTVHTPIDYPPPGEPWPTATTTPIVTGTATPPGYDVAGRTIPSRLEAGLRWEAPFQWVASGRGNVWTPAGAFADCWLLTEAVGAGFFRNRWFCPGVGVVREDACGNMGNYDLVIELLDADLGPRQR